MTRLNNRITNRMRKTAGFASENGIARSKIYVYNDCVSVDVMEIGDTLQVTGIGWDGNFCADVETTKEFISTLTAALNDIENNNFK